MMASQVRKDDWRGGTRATYLPIYVLTMKIVIFDAQRPLEVFFLIIFLQFRKQAREGQWLIHDHTASL